MNVTLRAIGFERRDMRLLWNFAKMNVRDKYLGSALGSAWAVANPLLLLTVFTFVFGFVYRVRLPGAETTLSYAIWLISGYGPWLATTESVMGATMSLVAASALIKNMAFKAEVLPIAAALTGILPLTVCSCLLVVLLFVDGNALSWHALFLVMVATLQFTFIAALGMFLSMVTVFIRDLGIALPNFLTIVLFATPIFYPIERLPFLLQWMSRLNPFYIISESYRQALVYHHVPGIWGLVYLFALVVLLGGSGLTTFRRFKSYLEARL
jgi:homopolymeric O-antigen transport system permease protein